MPRGEEGRCILSAERGGVSHEDGREVYPTDLYLLVWCKTMEYFPHAHALCIYYKFPRRILRNSTNWSTSDLSPMTAPSICAAAVACQCRKERRILWMRCMRQMNVDRWMHIDY